MAFRRACWGAGLAAVAIVLHASPGRAVGPGPRVRTELSAEQISSVQRLHRHELTQCLAIGARRFGLSATLSVAVGLSVDPSGTVYDVRARGDAPAEIATCIAQSVLRWRFPASRSGAVLPSMRVVYQPGA